MTLTYETSDKSTPPPNWAEIKSSRKNNQCLLFLASFLSSSKCKEGLTGKIWEADKEKHF